MLIVACREITSGDNGVRVDASSESASCTDKPSSPTTYTIFGDLCGVPFRSTDA